MRTHNYYYYGTPITKKSFEKNVPKNWLEESDEDYTYGGYKAIKLD